MKNRKECKGCSASVRVSFEEISAQMEEYIKTVDPEDRVAEEEYERRLQECSRCPALYYGSTCSYCGCFVRMRALRINKSCPYPGSRKW